VQPEEHLSEFASGPPEAPGRETRPVDPYPGEPTISSESIGKRAVRFVPETVFGYGDAEHRRDPGKDRELPRELKVGSGPAREPEDPPVVDLQGPEIPSTRQHADGAWRDLGESRTDRRSGGSSVEPGRGSRSAPHETLTLTMSV
jgi:hypothetical protein